MVELSEHESYARWLARGTRVGLAILVATFVAYLLGLLPAQVGIENLPHFWKLPAEEYLRQAGIPAGWGWLRFAGRGDILNLAGIAILAACSIPPLLAAIPAFRRRRETVFAAICAAEVLVLVVAASGLIAIH